MNLKATILKDIASGITPTHNRYLIQKSYFIDILEELKEKKLIAYSVIDDADSLFHGEPKDIWITDEGKNKL